MFEARLVEGSIESSVPCGDSGRCGSPVQTTSTHLRPWHTGSRAGSPTTDDTLVSWPLQTRRATPPVPPLSNPYATPAPCLESSENVPHRPAQHQPNRILVR